MKPAEPVTRTLATMLLLDGRLVVRGWLGRHRSPGRELLQRESAAEAEPVPAQVLGEEPAKIEAGLAELAVQPDGGDLRHRTPEPGSLRGQLQPDLESRAGLDPDAADECGVVGLEAVGRIPGADPGEQVQAPPRPPGEEPLQPGAP